MLVNGKDEWNNLERKTCIQAKPIKQNLLSSKTERSKPDLQQNLESKTCIEAKPI